MPLNDHFRGPLALATRRVDNMPTKKRPVCFMCGKGRLRPQTVDETFDYETDTNRVTVTAKDVPVEICDHCGERYRGPEAAILRNRATAQALRLLSLEDIRNLRKQLRLSLAQFARLTGIDQDLLADWENGRLLPTRALDNYLRLLQNDPQAILTLKHLRVEARSSSFSRA